MEPISIYLESDEVIIAEDSAEGTAALLLPIPKKSLEKIDTQYNVTEETLIVAVPVLNKTLIDALPVCLISLSIIKSAFPAHR